MSEDPNRGSARQPRIRDPILFGIGIMMATLCGSCTVALGLPMLGSGNLEATPILLMFGGLPTFAGLAMVVSSLNLGSSRKGS
ncbi:hypothetical protein [Phenylobacterium sp.]|uniref:hypothetical protein n=1 Tax=Phenylobacterium sp. TaxID=1871053 RepID=UPI003BAA8EB4